MEAYLVVVVTIYSNNLKKSKIRQHWQHFTGNWGTGSIDQSKTLVMGTIIVELSMNV